MMVPGGVRRTFRPGYQRDGGRYEALRPVPKYAEQTKAKGYSLIVRRWRSAAIRMPLGPGIEC